MKVFNTGKVQIGSAYFPRVRPSMDWDAYRLQEALLDKRPTPGLLGRILHKIYNWF